MSNVTLERSKPEEISISKSSIVQYFHAFCTHKYGSAKWDEYMNDDTFRSMIEIYEPKYGDAVFSTIADYVCEYENISIKDLLKEFSDFIHKYY